MTSFATLSHRNPACAFRCRQNGLSSGFLRVYFIALLKHFHQKPIATVRLVCLTKLRRPDTFPPFMIMIKGSYISSVSETFPMTTLRIRGRLLWTQFTRTIVFTLTSGSLILVCFRIAYKYGVFSLKLIGIVGTSEWSGMSSTCNAPGCRNDRRLSER